MSQVNVNIKRLDPEVELPRYAYEGDAGLDIRANESVDIPPHERALISTGLAIALPDGYAGFMQPRSGMALKRGLSIANTPGRDEQGLLAATRRRALKILGLHPADVEAAELARVSVDARKKKDVHFVASARLTLRRGLSDGAVVAEVPARDASHVAVLDAAPAAWPRLQPSGAALAERPVVVGAGCAGLFCALALAEAGLKPLLIERGDDARRRTDRVTRFDRTGELDPECNIQFGLGGAGTFSDGKLTTGTRNPDHRLILQTFVEAGVPPATRARSAAGSGMGTLASSAWV